MISKLKRSEIRVRISCQLLHSSTNRFRCRSLMEIASFVKFRARIRATVRLEGCYRGKGPKIEACRLKDNLDDPLTFLIIIGIGVVALLVGNDTIDIARRGSTPFFD